MTPETHAITIEPEPEAAAEPDLIRRARESLRDLLRLVTDRGEAEAAIPARRAAGDDAADREFTRATEVLAEKVRSRDEKARLDDERRRRAAIDAGIAGEADAKSDFARASRRISAEFDATRQRSVDDHRREKSDAAGTAGSEDRQATARLASARRPIDDASRIAATYRARLAVLSETYRGLKLADPPTIPSRESSRRDDDPLGTLLDRLAAIDHPLNYLERLALPKLTVGSRPAWFFALAFAMLAPPLVWALDWGPGLGAALVGAVAGGLALRHWVRSVAKRQFDGSAGPVTQAVVDAESVAARLVAAEEERTRVDRAEVVTRRDEALAAAKAKAARTLAAGENLRDERLREINEAYARRMVEVGTAQQVALREAIDAHDRRTAELRTLAESNAAMLDEKYRDLKARVLARFETAWADLAARWREGIARVSAEAGSISREVDALTPPWDDSDRATPPATPPVVRFGEVRVTLADLPGGSPADPALAEGVPASFAFPALRPFPDRGNLVVEAPASARGEAVGAIRSAMLRLLTALPPGSVRFTVVDPGGLGRDFGAFMHLADAGDTLDGGRAWTEPREVAERLDDLAAHTEQVARRYLRDDYATLAEYNAAAGEVAEPYRVLVLADVPGGLDERMTARVAAIAADGIACGVLTLAPIDPDRPAPPGLADALRSRSTRLAWDGHRLAWDDPDFGPFPLALDPFPPPERASALIRRAAESARVARRVEVPFAFIEPSAEQVWKGDSRAGVDVALGKSGPNQRQHLSLGKGTAQHVLVAGRTGSGKSTLLHALITNLALNYSPDEVELYLVDFKKGVEFKAYATGGLPHAAVVAIESEREFGISVLGRLDAELRSRADRFREAGVSDLNGFRNAGSDVLPRILLIVDEFQEFFVEEDRLAQEAALLLDRLVRQGRAFGVHVVLGSQTLGGAFTLARTTMGQMAVRIALPCGEADAHLILGEANDAAMHLSRPGEAVYNDANGQPEANKFFQVVWLGDDRRRAILETLRNLARDRPPALDRPTIVFEGDAPADLGTNDRLSDLLSAETWPASPRSALAWLGDPVAIQPPTSAAFRRQGGGHLLIVGQDDDAARGVSAAALLSLAAQFVPSESGTARLGARFVLLDGTPEDDPRADSYRRLAGAIPHRVDLGDWREAPRLLAELAAEVDRRSQPGGQDGSEVFLFVHDLGRFRDLRKADDDFGFSRGDKPATPAEHLRSILREGSSLGVHVVAWCDTLSNLNRAFDHQTLREFELRVLFQMSQNDSGHLLETPQASRLGPNRALLAVEGQNRVDKFRPYALPSEEWIERAKAAFFKRVETPGGAS